MRNPDRQTLFKFKQFDVRNELSAMKICTDSVLLGSWAFADDCITPADRHIRMLDIGCGTGVLALMLAQRFASAEAVGVEIDENAAGEAAVNFARSPFSTRLICEHADFTCWAGQQPAASFNLIISNPPYFTEGAKAPDASRLTARHQDSLPFASMIACAAGLLAPDGRIAIVLPYILASDARFAASMAGLETTRECTVATKEGKPPMRILMEMGHSPAPCLKKEQIAIRDAYGSFTNRYLQLVEPFYTHLK